MGDIKDLENLLGGALGEKVAIVQRKTKNLTAPGENYGSIMLALDLVIRKSDGDEEDLNLVAKLLPVSELLRKTFDLENTVRKEVYAYTQAIPSLIRFQKDNNVSPVLDSFPKCYGGRIGLNNNIVSDDAVLLLENLKMQGFDCADRLVGFNFDEANFIVKDLARFHAIPIAYKIKRPEDFQHNIMPCLIPFRGFENMEDSIEKSFYDSFVNVVKETPEFQNYIEKIVQFIDDGIKDIKNPNRPIPTTPFATMTHSDYWVNNTMLLKNKKGKTIANKIVDLQITAYDSGLRDLAFFLYTSVIDSVLNQHYDDLIKAYYDSFVEQLKKFEINLDAFSWDKYLTELDDASVKEFQHIAFMLKPIFTERGKIDSMTTFDNSDFERTDLTGNTHRLKVVAVVNAFIERKLL